MPQPVPFYITTRKPTHENDPGAVAEGHYIYANGIVTLTNASGVPLSGGWNYELEGSVSPHEVAQRALRNWIAAQPKRRRVGPINYPPPAIV